MGAAAEPDKVQGWALGEEEASYGTILVACRLQQRVVWLSGKTRLAQLMLRSPELLPLALRALPTKLGSLGAKHGVHALLALIHLLSRRHWALHGMKYTGGTVDERGAVLTGLQYFVIGRSSILHTHERTESCVCTQNRFINSSLPCWLLAAVKAAGGSVLEGGNGVRVGGWVISSHKGPITGALLPPLLHAASCLLHAFGSCHIVVGQHQCGNADGVPYTASHFHAFALPSQLPIYHLPCALPCPARVLPPQADVLPQLCSCLRSP